jgi:hypothetical protein
LEARSSACHPISHRRLAREPIVLNREGGSSVAMAVGGGRRLQGNQEVQETKEMGTKGRRMRVWIRTLGSIPYLSSPASGSPSGTTLHAHTARSSYPGANKGGGPGPAHQSVLDGGMVVQRCRNVMPRTSRMWCPIGSRNVVTIASAPATFAAWCPIGSGIVVLIASGPMTSAAR